MKLRLCSVIAGIFAIVLGQYFGGCLVVDKGKSPDVPLAAMQRNFGAGSIKPPHADSFGVLLRRDSKKNGDVLAQFIDTRETYRYEAALASFRPATEEEWLSGEDEVDCRERQFSRNQFLYVDISQKTLSFTNNGEQILSVGEFPLAVSESPTKKLAAILSAAGPKTSELPGYPGLGGSGGEITGKRYVQILDVTTRKFVGKPVGLAGVKEIPDHRFCWPDDEKFVAVFEAESPGAGKQIQLSLSLIKIDTVGE